MKLILFITLFLASSCKLETASTLSSGSLQDKINSDSTVTLNYRIDPQAVSSHQSLLVLNQLQLLKEDKIPSAWDFPTLIRIANFLSYLHYKSNNESVKSIDVIDVEGLKRIVFHLEKEDFILIVDKNFTELRWLADNGDVITMKKLAQNNWDIQKLNNHFFWKVASSEICDLYECIKL